MAYLAIRGSDLLHLSRYPKSIHIPTLMIQECRNLRIRTFKSRFHSSNIFFIHCDRFFCSDWIRPSLFNQTHNFYIDGPCDDYVLRRFNDIRTYPLSLNYWPSINSPQLFIREKYQHGVHLNVHYLKDYEFEKTLNRYCRNSIPLSSILLQ